MKKLLAILGAVSFTAIASTSVVACSSGTSIKGNIEAPTGLSIQIGSETKNSDFLTNSTITNAVTTAFTNSTNETVKKAVAGTDYEITVANPDATPSAGKLTFTITGKGSLKGKVTFDVTITAAGGGGFN